jgi:alpha-tubulin suppressor-like RCC1 family protein/subtilisin-like proprotein convertase family protein
LIDTVVGLNRVIDGMTVATMVITDVSDLVDLQITNTDTNSQIPFSIDQNNRNQTNVRVFYPEAMLNTDVLPLKIVTTDSAQHTTTFVGSVIIDNDAPVLQGGVVNAKVNGVKTALSNNATITRTNDLDLHVAWSSLTDRVAVALTQFEYTKQTITNTIFVSTTQITGMRAPAIDAPEGSRIVPSMRLRDTMGNEGVVALPIVYVDNAVTPDYTQISSNANDVYRGWLQNGCAALGVNADQTQRFATTWDANALRLNWQGSDWNIDGDLFVYLDTVAGGTITPYIPSKFDRVLSDKIATGDAFVTLPIDMAGRTSAAGTLSLFMNKWQQQLRDVLRNGRSSSAVEGADYVIYMGRNDTIAVLRWDSVSSAWVTVNESPSMKYSVVNNIKQTDIRVLFSTIGYSVGTPVGMMAFASKENYLLPWATFPVNNPTKNSLGTNKITITPLLNGYSWASLGSGVCPRTAARNPDTTQVLASLASNPSGVSTRAVSDVFVNTQPDVIAEAIDQTSDMCAQLATDPWCKTVSQLADTAAAGAALIPQLTNDLVTQQAPVIGKNSLITYTLQLQNQSNKPTKRMYGIVRTYGGIWLTGTINPNATNGVYDGGRYDYHTVTVPEYADFQVLKIESIPANSSRSISVTAKADPLKAQSSSFDRRNTSNVAKIDVRLVDTAAVTSTNSLAWLTTGRTIEWVNAGLRIDTEAPRQIKPDNQLVVGAGNVRLTGSVTDDSAVPVVMLEYTNNLSPSVSSVNCGAAVTGRWSCPIVVPRTAATINYRVRGSDQYGQMNAWSAWYRSSVDRDKPTFVLDTISDSALNATYVGGSTINLSGVLTDSTTTAAIQFCDEQQADCRTIVPSDNALTQTASSTKSVTSPVTAIAAQPCDATAFDAYTVYPITVTNVADGRVDTVTLNTTLAHAAAQDIDLWLQSPSGTRVALLTSTRTATTNVRAMLDDSAIRTTTSISGTTALSDAYTLVRPDGVLSTFTGEAAAGTWRLLACDRNTDGVTGTINNAQLTIATRSAARHQLADWNLTLANTAGQDNVARTVQFWSVDGAGNVSNARIAVMQIDTVAPTLDVTQNDTVVFPSGSANTFQGTTSDGGTLRNLRANVYDTNSLVDTIDLIPVQTSNSTLQRMNYLQNRATRYYTWTLPASELSGLASGTYTVQFVASDVIGNQRTSLPAPFTIPTKTAPAFNDVQVVNSATVNSQTIRTHIDTGYSDTTISAQVALDNDANVYTDTTTVKGWQYDGSTDTVLQGAIPSTIQTIPVTKLEMNNDFAAALDQSGTLRTWAVDGRADHISTSNQIAGLTPINNLVQFSIAEQLMWDNYLLTLDKNGVVREYRQPDGAANVVENPVVIRNRTNQLITNNIVAIDAGYRHTLVLLRSGQVITCSHTTATCKDEALNSTAVFKATPAAAQYGVTQIQAGIDFSVVLRSDRKVVAWGDSSYNHLAIPAGIKPVTQIAVGGDHTLALQDDGTVVAWGDNSLGQSTVPNGLTDVVYVAAGANSSAAVTRNGQVVIWGENTFTMTASNCCASAIAMNYAYLDNQSNQVTAQTITVHKTGMQTTSTVLDAAQFAVSHDVRFSGLIPGRRYRYTLTLTNAQGTQTYSGVFVNNLVFNKIFTPLLLNSSPAILPLVKGK